MDTDIPQILCSKIDEHAGAWPSESFVNLFRIARKCVEPKVHHRPEINEVGVEWCVVCGVVCGGCGVVCGGCVVWCGVVCGV